MFAENTQYEILTPSGWQDFNGVTIVEKETITMKFSTGEDITATKGHYFYSNGHKIQMKDLKIGDKIDTIGGNNIIVDLFANGKKEVYDIIEVKDPAHQYIVNNNIITKNCDEFSYVRPTIAREFWTSISPTLSTGGKAIITTTPNSDDDTFSHIWREANKTIDEYGNQLDIGANGFKAFRADWTVHPDRDEKWGQEERSRLGDEKFRREHCLEFIRDEELLINSLKLTTLEGKDPLYKQGQIRWYKNPDRQYTYLAALDPSLGTGGDPAAIQVFEMPSFTQVAEWQHNRTMIPGQIQVLKQITQHIKETAGDDTTIYWSVENNTIGEAALITIDEMGEENIPGTFLSEPAKMGSGRRYRRGFTTTNKSKITACNKFKNLLETDRLTINSKNLISELKNFIASGGSYKAKIGEKDDLVMATLLAVRMGQFISGFDDKIYDRFAEKFEAESQVPLPIYILR